MDKQETGGIVRKDVEEAMKKLSIFIAAVSLAKTTGNRDAALLFASDMGTDFGKAIVAAAQIVIEETRGGTLAPEVDAACAILRAAQGEDNG